jgi:hypothetical protein
MIAPDPLPLQPEPRRKLFASASQLRLQRLATDPAPRPNLRRIAHDRLVATPDIDRTQFPFGPGVIKLCLVLKLEQKPQRAADASSSCKRRWAAASRLSERRGWLQQLLDQKSGHRRLDAPRCCNKSSPASLKISNEKARCRMPRPSWQAALLRCPSSRSAASTRMSNSESAAYGAPAPSQAFSDPSGSALNCIALQRIHARPKRHPGVTPYPSAQDAAQDAQVHE